MSQPRPVRVHVVTGGFPPGSAAGHDMDYARLRILQLLQETPGLLATVGNDFTDVAKWLPGSSLLITYVAGPHLNDEQSELVKGWLEGGGHWLALHGTSGGRAVPVTEPRKGRMMVKSSHHAALGSFFLNHPPVRKFRVDVVDRNHPLTQGMPPSFETTDELYLIELQEPAAAHVLMTENSIMTRRHRDSASFTRKTPRLCPTGRRACLVTSGRLAKAQSRTSHSAIAIHRSTTCNRLSIAASTRRELRRRYFAVRGKRPRSRCSCATASPGASRINPRGERIRCAKINASRRELAVSEPARNTLADLFVHEVDNLLDRARRVR